MNQLDLHPIRVLFGDIHAGNSRVELVHRQGASFRRAKQTHGRAPPGRHESTAVAMSV